MADQPASVGTRATGVQFAVDGKVPDARYEAVSLGARWNGWETPVVTRTTFETLLRTENPDGEWYRLAFDEKGVATLRYPQDPDCEDLSVAPTPDGYYDLSELGWLFYCPESEVRQPGRQSHEGESRTMEDKVLKREAVDRPEPSSSVRVTLNPRDSIELGKVLSANDSFLLEQTTLESVEGYEVFVELDWTWQRELQTGSAFVWISVPGARFSTHLSRPLGRDLGAVLLGESDVLVPMWMTCDADEPDDPLASPAGNSDLFPVYFVPTRANMAEVAAPKKAPVEKIPVQRRTVPTRAARRSKAHRR